MFKSKKIVALVLCAMMLFVPLAAAAEDAFNVDFLKKFSENATVNHATLQGKVTSYKTAVKGLIGSDASNVDTNETTLKTAVSEYEEELKNVRKLVADAEFYKNQVEALGGYKQFTGSKFGGRKEKGEATAAKEMWEAAIKALATSKKNIEKEVAAYNGYADYYKLAQSAATYIRKNAEKAKNFAEASQVLTETQGWYDALENDEYIAQAAPIMLKAWNNFVAVATPAQKASYLATLKTLAEETNTSKLLLKGEDKYEVKSTGEKGWILSDEAKNGCLKDVAEFKVEKKDGKFVAKVYGADGKEMKIGQQLTVYRPIAKDVKVLKAKVDGKDVTFSVGLRNGQNYVSVPVIY